jgi:hypothetical protein
MLIYSSSIMLLLILSVLLLYSSNAYVINKNTINKNTINKKNDNIRQCNALKASTEIGVATITLLASAIGGSCGIGVAFPLDSIKTKIQSAASSGEKTGMKKMFIEVYKNEGIIKGFYSGLFPTMIGQSLYIASAFSANTWALTQLVESGVSPSIYQLCLAGAFGGLVASFVINPIERIKIQMQTGTCDAYGNSYDCLLQTIRSDGVLGLFFRGIDATLLREVPGYALYFLVYSYLSQQASGVIDPMLASLICGASAGAISCVPIYPFDVIKTNMQNKQTDDNNNNSMMVVAKELKNKFGMRIFYEGITPKLYKAIVSDSVTFMTYEMILKHMGITSVMSQ